MLFRSQSVAEEIESDRARLRERILVQAASWAAKVEAMSDETLFGELHYRSVRGDDYALPRVSIIHTMFTHGAHHRGQITTALHQWGKPTPEMDFPFFLLSLPRDQRLGGALSNAVA